MSATIDRTDPGQPLAADDLASRVSRACQRACDAIAPAWPLDQAIAVNPHWQRIDRPVREVAARMAVLAGLRVFPPPGQVQEAWSSGRITAGDLDEALARLASERPSHGPLPSASRCLEALRAPAACPRLPLLVDLLDEDPGRGTRPPWRAAITHQVSQTCAAWFDEDQADWQPARGAGSDGASGLYAFWRDTLAHDPGIGVLTGLPGLARRVDALPATREAAERWALQRLGLPEAAWVDYLEALLLTVQGWASWCAWRGWQARLAGRDDPHLRDLLAIRLAWGALLLECKDDAMARQAFARLRGEWAAAPARLREAEAVLAVDEAWQLAFELGYQRGLATRLAPGPASATCRESTERPAEAQAAFCIDVRSEPLRRALEAVDPSVRTLGFAGFFGVPLGYTPIGTAARRPQLPGLLAPTLEATDRMDAAAGAPRADVRATHARWRRLAVATSWQAASRWPASAFSFVEAAGLGYLAPLAGWLRPSRSRGAKPDQEGLPARYRPLCRPALADADLATRTATAAGALRAMGLDRSLAPLVVFVGHGSRSANNAHAATLQCGACGGQTGEVNARVLAGLLADPAVRAGLPGHGIDVPGDTVFVAALHDTTTDEVAGFDLDRLDPAARARWERLAQAFRHAGDQVRRERAPRLGLDPRAPHDALLAALRRRANDGAQTRPEWGLAGNASLVLAPRHRTRGRHLAGRAFLHDYDPSRDPQGTVLAQLMTAPMLVSHWINWQYHASTCEPGRLGSGSKVLHNVVGGRIGVFEGNGGDLRIGLSRQSLHDGRQWMHEPLRLTVVVDAPRDRIDAVLRAHDTVRRLVENGWLHLWRFGADGPGLERRAAGEWRAVDA